MVGKTVSDLSAYARQVPFTVPTVAADGFGLGIDFSAGGYDTDRVIFASASGLPTAASASFTLHAVWWNDVYVSLSSIWGFGVGAGSGEHRRILQYNNNFYFWGNSNDWDTGVTWSGLTGLQFVTFTYDGAALRLYVDGVLRAGPQAIGFATAEATIVGGGGHPSGTGPNGRLHEGRIYNRALSPGEVWELFDPRTRFDLYQPWRRQFRIPPYGGGSAKPWLYRNHTRTLGAGFSRAIQ